MSTGNYLPTFLLKISPVLLQKTLSSIFLPNCNICLNSNTRPYTARRLTTEHGAGSLCMSSPCGNTLRFIQDPGKTNSLCRMPCWITAFQFTSCDLTGVFSCFLLVLVNKKHLMFSPGWGFSLEGSETVVKSDNTLRFHTKGGSQWKESNLKNPLRARVCVGGCASCQWPVALRKPSTLCAVAGCYSFHWVWAAFYYPLMSLQKCARVRCSPPPVSWQKKLFAAQFYGKSPKLQSGNFWFPAQTETWSLQCPVEKVFLQASPNRNTEKER